MAKRPIIEIDRDKCNGCGLCTNACAEGALALDQEGKAVLLKEIYCDGLGACLDVCPTGALKVVQKDSKEYDAKASYEHVLKTRGEEVAEKVHGATHSHPTIPSPSLDKRGKGDGLSKAKSRGMGELACGCPGSMAREIKKTSPQDRIESKSNNYQSPDNCSELSQWPIQLHLVSPHAPYFQEADLLVAADCTAFAMGSFHKELLKGKRLVIFCPKLDDTSKYIDKLAELIKNNTIFSLTCAIMTVPCCMGTYHIVQEAVKKSGKDIAVRKIVISPEGQVK